MRDMWCPKSVEKRKYQLLEADHDSARGFVSRGTVQYNKHVTPLGGFKRIPLPDKTRYSQLLRTLPA